MDALNREKQKQPVNVRTKANFILKIFFWWLNPLMKLGTKKELQIEDLYQALPEDETEKLGLKLQKEWEKELVKLSINSEHPKKSGMSPSLAKAVLRTFGPDYMMLSLAALVSECVFRIGQPLCLGQLINYFDPGSEMTDWEAYLYATGVVLGSLLYTIVIHPYFFECYHYGMKLRIAACYLVYKKCLRLNQMALSETNTGQIVNLMSNDVGRFDSSAIYLHYLYIGPIQAIIVAVVLYFYVIGPSCLAGMAILIFFAPFQTWMGKIFSQLRLETAGKTDTRIGTMNEIIAGMRVIKMYTWEKPFASLIDLYRRLEVAVIRRTSVYRAINTSLYFISSKLIIFITFVVYVLTGNALTAEKVFLTVALFDNIRIGMTWYFPAGIAALAEALISIERIQDLLLLSEKGQEESSENQRPNKVDCRIDCKNATVKWPSTTIDDKEDKGNTLSDVSFTVKPGQLMAVIGQVGAGKSSILNVILGELMPTIGSCEVNGRMAYASQEPWIFSATIRQNILCGSNYDPQRYKKVIKASALDKDFTLLPQGDHTAVGEKGVALSGGQRARINLARCLYVDADIYLLDDPLSAVDTHVGRHLFDMAVNGFLRDKIRVLVTHQLQYLKDVDQILVLKAGRVDMIGTYHELLKQGLDFEKIMEEEEDIDDESKPVDRRYSTLLDGMEPRSRSESKISLQKRRSSSVISKSSFSKREEENPVFEEEIRESGSVSLSIYWKYLHTGGSYISLIFLVLFFLGAQVFYSGSDYWLNIWTNAEQMHNSSSNSSSWEDELDTNTGIYVYSILISCLFLFSIARGIHFFIICMISSVKLHDQMFKALIRAPLSFFDSNPVGRILNRFAKDIGCMDEQIPATFFDVISIFLNMLGIIVVVGIVNLWLVLPVAFLAIFFYKLSQIYVATARSVKRLESTTRSPVFTHVSSSLSGLTTLRAHQCGSIFQRVFNQCQNAHSSAYYLYIATARWFGIQMDWVALLYIGCITYTCTALQGSMTGSEAGLAISSAMSLTGTLQWGVRQAADTENQMTSVERVVEYGQLPSEAPLESTKDKKPEEKWPREGNIEFDKMSLRYKESDKPVLNEVSCVIQSKQKVGIVGRTGAGKSSLIAAIFRLTEPDGRILIDGIDTKSIGLHDLRSKVSIIPQDPVLFSGTMRKNLDPFGEYDDQILWNSLEDVKLKELMTNDFIAGLDYSITEGGSNLSVGERQLVCLARAILRQNKILVLDEATANVDQKTDALIQLTIRDKFKDCTVLTIAHRLNTIMDSDKVMVMDAGCLMEFNEPMILLSNKQSLFSRLVEQTGIECASELIELANQATMKRNATDSINQIPE